MVRIILVFFLATLFNVLYSQENNIDSTNGNKNIIIQEKRIDELKEAYISSYKLMGYRIQIFSGNQKQPARDARLTFTQAFSKVKAHEIYEQPYFKVRVGDFKSKIEALKFKNELIKYFPNCFIVQDEIDFIED